MVVFFYDFSHSSVNLSLNHTAVSFYSSWIVISCLIMMLKAGTGPCSQERICVFKVCAYVCV